ncbi:unnamed protein product [Phaeothamnion confervicola]
MAASSATTAATVVDLQAQIDALQANSAASIDVDAMWLMLTGVLVFFMQVGFAMLEVGSVAPKNTKSILIKNTVDTSICSICWWLVGYGFAYGKSKGGFIGTSEFALLGPTFNNPAGGPATPQIGYNWAFWFFSWTFAATSTTIVSGAIAERVKVFAYLVYSVFVSALIYPVVVHGVWSAEGWASSENYGNLLMGCGSVDFAGSGGVHMVGGICSVVAAIVAKPRAGRFNADGTVNKKPQQSPALQTLGALILWCGWYGFNCGSTLTITGGRSAVAAVTAVNTTIAPSAGACTTVILIRWLENRFDSSVVNCGILAALVAITAGCSVVSPAGAFTIGVIAGFVYVGSRKFLLMLRIDDVAEAAPVHLFGGIWGVFAAGLFATEDNYAAAYPDPYDAGRPARCKGLFYGGSGHLLAANVIYMLFILAWVGGISLILFIGIKYTIGLRVSLQEEERGMDQTRRGSRKTSAAQPIRKAMAAASFDTRRSMGLDSYFTRSASSS